MKALSLTQPWATLVALEAKRIETRSWATKYRGPIAIHAAKSFPGWCRDLCYASPFAEILSARGLDPDNLPLGAVLCTTEIVDCVRTESIAEAPCYYSEAEHEIEFGDYSASRYGFLFGAVRRLPTPVAVKGHLGLWPWNEEAA